MISAQQQKDCLKQMLKEHRSRSKYNRDCITETSEESEEEQEESKSAVSGDDASHDDEEHESVSASFEVVSDCPVQAHCSGMTSGPDRGKEKGVSLSQSILSPWEIPPPSPLREPESDGSVTETSESSMETLLEERDDHDSRRYSISLKQGSEAERVIKFTVGPDQRDIQPYSH